jgi:hypothetical protein
MNKNEVEYAFIIYSCKKNLDKATAFYNRFKLNVERDFNMKMMILYGDNIAKKQTYEIREEKYLVINVSDDYQSLDLKTLKLFKTIRKVYPNLKGCFKCDDDVVLNIFGLYNFILFLGKFNIDYSGCSSIMDNSELDNNSHISKKDIFISKKIKKPNAIYCGGPIYYLSKTAIEIIEKTNYRDVEHIFYEDLMIGYILNQNHIFPVHYDLYNDEIIYFNSKKCSYHNKDHKNILFIRIHGGLGNQMFQIASGIAIAEKNNMVYYVVNSSDVCKQDFTHTLDNNILFRSIFSKFPSIKLEHINLQNVKRYKEKESDCFIKNEIILNEDTFLDGYFQNEKYFKEYKNTIITNFKANESYQKCLKNLTTNEKLYKTINNSYFIHVRRGDYVNHPLHQINYDTYFPKAISYILERDKDAYFYIVSDDIDFCKHNPLFDTINRSFLEMMPSTETIYFMSFCFKGGICSNSTFSWWGSYLNENPDKLVLFPSKWLNNNSPNDIYYEGSVIIDV